eukprot:1317961-Pleurochrysis_carterae.AAC.1
MKPTSKLPLSAAARPGAGAATRRRAQGSGAKQKAGARRQAPTTRRGRGCEGAAQRGEAPTAATTPTG